MCRLIPVIAVLLTTLFSVLPSLTMAPESLLTDEMRGKLCLPLNVNFSLLPVSGVISRRCSPEEIKKKAAAELVGKDLSLRLNTLELSRADRRVPEIKGKITPGERPLSDYRYHNEYVKYEKLEDKGLKYDQVAPARPMAFGRPRPASLFATAARQPGKAGSIEREQVSIQLLEEAGVDRAGRMRGLSGTDIGNREKKLEEAH